MNNLPQTNHNYTKNNTHKEIKHGPEEKRTVFGSGTGIKCSVNAFSLGWQQAFHCISNHPNFLNNNANPLITQELWLKKTVSNFPSDLFLQRPGLLQLHLQGMARQG